MLLPLQPLPGTLHLPIGGQEEEAGSSLVSIWLPSMGPVRTGMSPGGGGTSCCLTPTTSL